MKKKLIIPAIVTLSLIIVLIGSIIYAWYTNVYFVSNMKFNILQIDSLVTLYEANDSNYNGVPDYLATDKIDTYYNEESNSDIEYLLPYYTEHFSYNYLDQKYALSQTSTANLLNTIEIEGAVPSKVYSYKFEVTNYIGKANNLSFSFVDNNTIDTSILKDFDVRLGVVIDNENIDFTDWTNFCSESSGTYSYSGFSLNPYNTPIILPAETEPHKVGRLDLWLQVRINKEATEPLTSAFLLPTYRIELSCEIPD